MSDPLLWARSHVIRKYAVAVLSVTVALILAQWPLLQLGAAPVSLFLCAVMLSAWFGGLAPGFLAIALSGIAFYYYFLPPLHSLGAKPHDIPRLIAFTVSNLLVGLLTAAQSSATESLRRARDDLRGTVQELQKTNEALRIESAERQQARDKLRRSEGYLAEAQRLSQTGSWARISASGEMSYWSEECYRVLGFDPQDGPPRFETFFQRIHPDDQARLREVVEEAHRNKAEYEMDYRIVHPGGQIRDIHVVGHPVISPSGEPIQFVGTVMDVTERKRAEEALRRSEAYLAEAQRLSHIGSWACNILTKEIIHSSEEHSRLYGFNPRKGMPSMRELVRRIHPEDRAQVMQAFESASREEKDFDTYFRIVLPDGTTKYVYGTGHPVFKPPGDVGEFVGIVMDLTERKRAEEEREKLRQAQADLARVSRVTTMGELSASLAHEVRQPIAAAITDANTCLRWLTRDLPDLEEARAAALRVVKDATRASEIVSRIRLFFKKGAAQRELVDVNEVIREMIVLLRNETMRYSISVRTELAEDLPQVMGDRVQLQQVMMNLMMNSIEAMKDVNGLRELAIKSQPADNGNLMVSVSDTGVGLPAEQTNQIFNAFFTTKLNGTGMGLSISRSIVESHEGRLWATPNSPGGATFHLTLPAKVEAYE